MSEVQKSEPEKDNPRRFTCILGASKTMKLADAYAFLLSDAGYLVCIGVTHKPCGAEISYPLLDRLGHQTYE